MKKEPQPPKISERWGCAVTQGITGFTAVPDVLIRSQHRLRISATELVVLLNLLMHWWDGDGWPYPRVSTISRRMNLGSRTIERALRSLEEKSLVVRQPTVAIEDGRAVRRFDLSGLVLALQELAAEYRTYGEDEEVSRMQPAGSDHSDGTPA